METPKARADRLAYSVAEAKRLTSLGHTTIFGLISSGKLASFTVGRRRLIKADSLHAFMEAA